MTIITDKTKVNPATQKPQNTSLSNSSAKLYPFEKRNIPANIKTIAEATMLIFRVNDFVLFFILITF